MSEPQMIVIECAQCSISFGITPALSAIRKRDYKSFCCPNGHAQSYVAGQEDVGDLRAKCAKLSADLEVARKKISALSDELAIWKPRDA